MLRDDDSEGGNCSDSDSLHPPDKLQFLEPLVRFEYPTQHEIWNLPSYRNNLVDNPRKTHTSFITSFNGFCKLTALISSMGAILLYSYSRHCWNLDKTRFKWEIYFFCLICSTSLTLIQYIIFTIIPRTRKVKTWLYIDLATTILCCLLTGVLGTTLLNPCYFHPIFTLGFACFGVLAAVFYGINGLWIKHLLTLNGVQNI